MKFNRNQAQYAINPIAKKFAIQCNPENRTAVKREYAMSVEKLAE